MPGAGIPPQINDLIVTRGGGESLKRPRSVLLAVARRRAAAVVAFEARWGPAAWPVGARRPHVTRAAPPPLLVRDERHVVAF